jgi:hypothetical protein
MTSVAAGLIRPSWPVPASCPRFAVLGRREARMTSVAAGLIRPSWPVPASCPRFAVL